MTIDTILKLLRSPSAEAWCRLVTWLNARPDEAVALVPRLQQLLASWPDSLLRAAPRRWLDEGRDPLLALCWAPGGLMVEASGGGRGLPAHCFTELVSPDRLEEAALDFLDDVFGETGDYDGEVIATPFAHGQVSGEPVELMGCIEATYAPLQATFRLNAIPDEVRARLCAHRQQCFESSNNDSPFPLVPLELRWVASELRWPSTEGTSDWHVFENLIIYGGRSPLYRDKDFVTHTRPTREYWPPQPPSDNEGVAVLLPQAAAALEELENQREVSIATMLAAKSAGELVHTLMTLVARFGLWKVSKRQIESAVEQALFKLTMLPDPSRRALRIREALDEFGELTGPALETVSGLLCLHKHDPAGLVDELKELQARELLVMKDAGEVDALVPLCAWALSSHASLEEARGALAEAIVDHPLVDDLFCADEALLAGRSA